MKNARNLYKDARYLGAYIMSKSGRQEMGEVMKVLNNRAFVES